MAIDRTVFCPYDACSTGHQFPPRRQGYPVKFTLALATKADQKDDHAPEVHQPYIIDGGNAFWIYDSTWDAISYGKVLLCEHCGKKTERNEDGDLSCSNRECFYFQGFDA